MESGSTRFVDDGIVRGIAWSLTIHLALIVFALAYPLYLPHMENKSPIYTVTLLDTCAIGGGSTPKAVLRDKVKKPTGAMKRAPAPSRLTANEYITRMIEKEKQPDPPFPQSSAVEKTEDTEPVTSKADPSPAAVAGNSSGDAFGRDSGAVSGDRGDGTGKENGDGPGQSGDTVGFGGSENDPAFIFKAIPKYPMRARKLGKEGTVLLLITLCEKGRLVSADLAE
ncbi:MAG: hypothetical protein WC799_17930, partial [Desulfobacteraceae bacterium]